MVHSMNTAIWLFLLAIAAAIPRLREDRFRSWASEGSPDEVSAGHAASHSNGRAAPEAAYG